MKYLLLVVAMLQAIPSQPGIDTLTVRQEATKQRVEYCIPDTVIYFNRHNLDNQDPAVILAAVAWHECMDLSMTERWLVMEAAWNRVVTNFNGNGATLKEQLTAPKQHEALFIFSITGKNHFVYDGSNHTARANYLMAQDIIDGARLAYDPIVYWACPTDRHFKQVVSRETIYLFTVQAFSL